MKLEIKEKQEKPLLERTEIVADLAFGGAVPSQNEVKAEIAKQVGGNKDLVWIIKIDTAFRQKTAKAVIHVYKSAEKLKEMVKKGKKALEKEKKLAEEAKKAAEEKKEEVAEEKKEEKSAE